MTRHSSHRGITGGESEGPFPLSKKSFLSEIPDFIKSLMNEEEHL